MQIRKIIPSVIENENTTLRNNFFYIWKRTIIFVQIIFEQFWFYNTPEPENVFICTSH